MNTNTTIEDIRKGQLKGLKKELESICLDYPNVIIFGAGKYGLDIFNMLKKYNMDKNIKAFCDNDIDKQGKHILNFKILSYFEAKKIYTNPFPLFLICSTYYDEIAEQLRRNGEERFLILNGKYQYIYREIFDDYNRIKSLIYWNSLYNKMNLDKIKMVYEMLDDEESKKVLNARMNLIRTANWSSLESVDISKKQYFQKDIFEFNDKEIFLDLGALNGDTILEFAKTVNYSYKKIIAFEPENENYKDMINNLSKNNIKNVKIYNLGTWSEKAVLNFSTTGCPHLTDSGECKINVDSLDNLFLDVPITFIKMDIEGAEKETLLGAKEVIKKYKPKLAVCVYHKTNDIYEIPILIKSLVPKYKIYLRHHSSNLTETVCYACI